MARSLAHGCSPGFLSCRDGLIRPPSGQVGQPAVHDAAFQRQHGVGPPLRTRAPKAPQASEQPAYQETQGNDGRQPEGQRVSCQRRLSLSRFAASVSRWAVSVRYPLCMALPRSTARGRSRSIFGLPSVRAFLQHGDTLTVWKLDRPGRGMGHLIDKVRGPDRRGIGFRSLTEGMDRTTRGGTLVFHLFGALARFERDLIRERTRAGLAAAAVRGRKGGRKAVVTAERLARARRRSKKVLPFARLRQASRLERGCTSESLGRCLFAASLSCRCLRYGGGDGLGSCVSAVPAIADRLRTRMLLCLVNACRERPLGWVLPMGLGMTHFAPTKDSDLGPAIDRLSSHSRRAPKAPISPGCSRVPVVPWWDVPTNKPLTRPGSSADETLVLEKNCKSP